MKDCSAWERLDWSRTDRTSSVTYLGTFRPMWWERLRLAFGASVYIAIETNYKPCPFVTLETIPLKDRPRGPNDVPPLGPPR